MRKLVPSKVKSQGIMSQLTAEAGVIKTFSHEEGKAWSHTEKLHDTGRQDLWGPVSDPSRRKGSVGSPRDAEIVAMQYTKASKHLLCLQFRPGLRTLNSDTRQMLLMV